SPPLARSGGPVHVARLWSRRAAVARPRLAVGVGPGPAARGRGRDQHARAVLRGAVRTGVRLPLAADPAAAAARRALARRLDGALPDGVSGAAVRPLLVDRDAWRRRLHLLA